MRGAIIGRIIGGVLMLIISIVAWRMNGEHRGTILLLPLAWSVYGVGVARFLVARRRAVKRSKLPMEKLGPSGGW